MAEEKLDGVSIVLYYTQGGLSRAVTRGNGRVGNDVTANVRTIRSVPLRLRESVDVAVRGEVFLPISDFRRLNDRAETSYANPRNLAAGSLRRAKSVETAQVPLTFLAYEGYFSREQPRTHRDILARLKSLGFRLNPELGLFSEDPGQIDSERARFPDAHIGSLEDLREFIDRETVERKSRDYEIDGLVLKLDSLARRELLGYTGHHPRWAIAYKFESPQGITRVRDIDVQVGRTGRVTPVARVEPVAIGGTTVSNVTLHNQAYVNALELGIGDLVSVSRRGDVIPAVEQVVEKNPDSSGPFSMPTHCPSCGNELLISGAHHFCVNYECPARMRGQLYFFVSRGQMDIDSLGSETLSLLIEKGMVRDIADIYEIDFSRLREFPGFGDKKIEALKTSIRNSLSRPYRTVLASLGIPEIGPKVVELLCDAGFHSIDDLFAVADAGDAEALVNIDGIGERTASVIIEELSRPSLRNLVARLRDHGLAFSETPQESRSDEAQPFAGQVWCVTGSFEHFKPRSRAAEQIKRRGGRVSSDVSGRTTHLLAGAAAGSKLTKARERGVEIVDESRFLEMLGHR
ncbi:MAG: NAD-dependent DNA ligase LigA [bacterium]